MNDSEQVALFVLLKAFDRLGLWLEGQGIALPQQAHRFIDLAWGCLAAGAATLNTQALDAAIDAAVVDEQGAGTAEILKNLYLYALADFTMFFSEATPASLSAAESAIVDAYDYGAGQQYVLERKQGKAVVLSVEDEQAIAGMPLYRDAVASLHADRTFAQGLGDWARVLEYR